MKFSRRDRNHKEIVEKFRSMGFFVHDIAELKNCADLIVTKGKSSYVEIKDGLKTASQKKLTDGEIKFKAEVERFGGRYFIVESVDDVEKVYLKIMQDGI